MVTTVMVKMMGRETSEGARCACVSSGTGGSITTITFLWQGQQHCNNNTTTHITRISSFSFATNPLSFMLFVSCFIEFKINIILLTIVVLKMGKSF